MMKILCCMLILLQGTLGAPFPESKRKTMKPFLGGFITENSGRSTEFKYEKAEDEFPRNKEQTQIIPVHEDGYDSLAFHAYLSSSQNYTASTIIKFDMAPVNVLNRYNPSTGKYIVGLLGLLRIYLDCCRR
ncbi:uncharacterized protein LOC132750495 isoform X2 [Ruditapes philippinarum]|nr:uncharacterized protein LOC132750495 isoform X2 [Ruditapes philippinarum]